MGTFGPSGAFFGLQALLHYALFHSLFFPRIFPHLFAQALLLSGRHAGLYNYINTKVGKLSLLLSM